MSRPARAPGSRRGGFTLIEVILATLIIGIGLLAMLTATSRCLAVVKGARFFEDAKHLLAELDIVEPIDMEEFEEGSTDGTFERPYEEFHWEREIRLASEEEEYPLYVVITRITRHAEGSRPEKEEVATLMYVPEDEEGAP